MRKKVREITNQTEKKQLIKQFIHLVSIDQVAFLTDRQYSQNSLLAMTKDWNHFVEFCQLKGVSPLPTSVTALRHFIEKQSDSRKYASIKRYTVTIGLFHRILGLQDPTSNSRIKSSLASTRIDKLGDAKVTAAFERKHLEQLSALLSRTNRPSDMRNLAIYHVMFECLLKRGELRDLTIDKFNINENSITLSLGLYNYTFSPETCCYLQRWFLLRNQTSQWAFSAIDKHGNIRSSQLNDSSIFRILRKASEVLELDVKFSGQSLRVGAAKQMAKDGKKVRDIQNYGRWLSAAMPYYYIGNRTQANLERMVFKTIKPWD
ncbi:tyrosine-type recombinase/integrase [Vibrio atypicus]|uniref:tyrosine-type recombinase/integrase n=1 Tax=Vibrio atypicus TaxID=558271 RepID=UPI0013582B09|nr:tyrosine-type recombinase/integrase [Vibrio atypicus]